MQLAPFDCLRARLIPQFQRIVRCLMMLQGLDIRADTSLLPVGDCQAIGRFSHGNSVAYHPLTLYNMNLDQVHLDGSWNTPQ